MKVEFVVRVWDVTSERLLCEASAPGDASLEDAIIQITGVSKDNPDRWDGEREIPRDQGRQILALMGKDFAEPGEFRLSLEQVPVDGLISRESWTGFS